MGMCTRHVGGRTASSVMCSSFLRQAFFDVHMTAGRPPLPTQFTVVALGLWGEGRYEHVAPMFCHSSDSLYATCMHD